MTYFSKVPDEKLRDMQMIEKIVREATNRVFRNFAPE